MITMPFVSRRRLEEAVHQQRLAELRADVADADRRFIVEQASKERDSYLRANKDLLDRCADLVDKMTHLQRLGFEVAPPRPPPPPPEPELDPRLVKVLDAIGLEGVERARVEGECRTALKAGQSIAQVRAELLGDPLDNNPVTYFRAPQAPEGSGTVFGEDQDD